MKKVNYSIRDFKIQFPDERACLDYIFKKKYPDLKGYYFVKGRKCYANAQGKQIHPVKGTIFEHSSTPLSLWFFAIYLFSNSKNGVSSKELQRQLGVTYKCAWRIGNSIRKLMKQGQGQLKGIVEIDETYVGGTRKLKHGKWDNKEAVMGMVERQGKIKAKHIPDRYDFTLLKNIRKDIKIGSHLMTDEWSAYKKTSKLGYRRNSIKHFQKEYVRGIVHTNTIEGFWSQLKRSISGTYVSVSPKYLQSYVDEFAYRYNQRNSAYPIFSALIERV